MSELYSYEFSAMGGPCSVHLYADAESVADVAAESAIAEVERIERRYSRYRPDSMLADINRVAAQGGRIAVDSETAGLLDYAYTCHRRSGGLFDISSGLLRKAWDFTSERLPSQHELDRLRARVGLQRVRWEVPWLAFDTAGMEMDFGGIGKEYAADRAAGRCAAAGIRHGLVELGGDIHVIGPHPDGRPWEIGIRHPQAPETPFAYVHIARGGLAASGDYARCIVVDGVRYSHILDPTTGWPVTGLAAVSVQAECCMVAGSVSTIAMLKGTAGAAWLQTLSVPHLWIDTGGRHGGTLLAPGPALSSAS